MSSPLDEARRRMEDHWRQLREQAPALPPGAPPRPWGGEVYLHAGGVIAAGWTAAEHLLLVSADGYSLTEPRSGERLERDRDSRRGYACLSPTRLAFTLPTTGEIVPVFGVHGGGGVAGTEDGWHLRALAPAWPDEIVVLWDPSAAQPGAVRHGYFFGAHRLATTGLAGELRGCGFAPSGRHFTIVASDGTLVFSRDA